jgi:hypothetical protein
MRPLQDLTLRTWTAATALTKVSAVPKDLGNRRRRIDRWRLYLSRTRISIPGDMVLKSQPESALICSISSMLRSGASPRRIVLFSYTPEVERYTRPQVGDVIRELEALLTY